MEIRLHANATTTPKQRAYSQQSTRPAAELAVEIGVSETTIRRWRARDTVRDRPHTPHRLATILNPLQEFVVVELRKLLLLPLDDLLVVAREFVCPELSRSALDRCLRRHGVARLADLLPEAEDQPPLPKTFNANYALCGRAFNRNMAAASRAKTWTRRPRKERTLLAHSIPVFS